MHAQGFGSRRECRALVRLGRVRVAGAPAEDPDAALAELMGEAAPQDWALEVDGRHWPYRERAVVMLHKPAGYECSLKPRHHPSVMSLLPTPLRLRGLQP
ncbi:MAG: S4 domain-containing protein, partial [Betaproteobacteria bacterium]